VAVDHVDILADRMDRFERNLDKIGEALKKLASLEAHHLETREALTRAFNAIEAVRIECRDSHKTAGDRLAAIEREMPMMRRLTAVMFAGMVAGFGLLLVAVGKASGVLS